METIIASLLFASILYLLIALTIRADESYNGTDNLRYEVESYR